MFGTRATVQLDCMLHLPAVHWRPLRCIPTSAATDTTHLAGQSAVSRHRTVRLEGGNCEPARAANHRVHGRHVTHTEQQVCCCTTTDPVAHTLNRMHRCHRLLHHLQPPKSNPAQQLHCYHTAAVNMAAPTAGYRLHHTMLRVKDIEKSKDFYTRLLGTYCLHCCSAAAVP